MSNSISMSPGNFMIMEWLSQRKRKSPKDRWLGFGFALSTHIAILLVGGLIFIKPIEFGVDRGLSSMDVQLVAGTPEPETAPQEVKQELISQPVQNLDAVQTPVQEKVEEQVKTSTLGNSTVSAVSTDQGAETEIQPSYMNNPAPRYPFEARQKGWEGTVELKVAVDRDGRPMNVLIHQTSGYKILDEAALKTVKTWHFRPALFGNVAVESSVIVPIRFNLKNS